MKVRNMAIEVIGTPAFGGALSFNVTEFPGGKAPDGGFWLRNSAYVDDEEVYQQNLHVPQPGTVGPFTLGPTNSWSSGPADGEAQLYRIDNGVTKMIRKPAFRVSYEIAG
jgi:hypothetical protein